MIPFYSYETDSFLSITNEERIRRPLSICIRLFQYCNLSCKYCISSSSSSQPHDISKDIVYSIIDLLSKKGSLRLVWSGGEPLLSKHLGDVLNYSHSHNNCNVVATNGLIFPNEDVAIHADWYQVSCFSLRRNLNLELRGDDILSRLLKNVNQMLSMGLNVSIFIPISHDNLDEVFDIVSTFIDIGIEKFTLNWVIDVDNYKNTLNKSVAYSYIKAILEPLIIHTKVNVIFPVMTKLESFKKGYYVINSQGIVEAPYSLVNINILKDNLSFWRGVDQSLDCHWELFTTIQ